MWPHVSNHIFLYTCMQNTRLRTVYWQRKWPLLSPVREIMALERKRMALGCGCGLRHVLRSFNGAVQRRIATLTVTMLISSCWQLCSEVELRRIFDVCKRWANSGFACSCKENMVRYIRPHRRFAHCSCKNAALTLDLGLSASVAGSCCIFTLTVRQPPILATCIEIYYFFTNACETQVGSPFTDIENAS